MTKRQIKITIVTLEGIDIVITPKKIKNTHLRVRGSDGSVSVSVPLFADKDYIMRFLQCKLPWIKKQLTKFNSMPKSTKKEYKTGDNIYLFGQKYSLLVVDSSISKVERAEKNIILFIAPNSAAAKRKEAISRYYKEQLQVVLPSIIAKWQEITNFSCSAWRLRDMTTRWGSFSTKTKKITLNVQLAMLPLPFIEYVTLHELAHSKAPNHGKEFIDIMDKYMPNWRTVKQLSSTIYNI